MKDGYICLMHHPVYPYLEIRITPRRGRGVFSARPLPEGFLIEEAPVIVMPEKDRTLLDQTLLHDYIFEWHAGGEKGCCMALGYVPVYNHDSPSNCEYVMDYETNTIRIYAVRDIAAGEELTINYNGDFDAAGAVWFKQE